MFTKAIDGQRQLVTSMRTAFFLSFVSLVTAVEIEPKIAGLEILEDSGKLSFCYLIVVGFHKSASIHNGKQLKKATKTEPFSLTDIMSTFGAIGKMIQSVASTKSESGTDSLSAMIPSILALLQNLPQ